MTDPTPPGFDPHMPPQPQPYLQPQPGHEAMQPGYGPPAGDPLPAADAYGQPAGYGQAVQPYAGWPGSAVAPQQPYPYQQMAMPMQPAGIRLVSPGGRLGGALLDGVLAIVTLGIGWLIWSMITWSNGQTPAKALLGHVTVDGNTGQPFDWGRMFLREFCIKGLLGYLLGSLSCGIYSLVDDLMVFGDNYRTLHDRMSGSLVSYR